MNELPHTKTIGPSHSKRSGRTKQHFLEHQSEGARAKLPFPYGLNHMPIKGSDSPSPIANLSQRLPIFANRFGIHRRPVGPVPKQPATAGE